MTAAIAYLPITWDWTYTLGDDGLAQGMHKHMGWMQATDEARRDDDGLAGGLLTVGLVIIFTPFSFALTGANCK